MEFSIKKITMLAFTLLCAGQPVVLVAGKNGKKEKAPLSTSAKLFNELAIQKQTSPSTWKRPVELLKEYTVDVIKKYIPENNVRNWALVATAFHGYYELLGSGNCGKIITTIKKADHNNIMREKVVTIQGSRVRLALAVLSASYTGNRLFSWWNDYKYKILMEKIADLSKQIANLSKQLKETKKELKKEHENGRKHTTEEIKKNIEAVKDLITKLESTLKTKIKIAHKNTQKALLDKLKQAHKTITKLNKKLDDIKTQNEQTHENQGKMLTNFDSILDSALKDFDVPDKLENTTNPLDENNPNLV